MKVFLIFILFAAGTATQLFSQQVRGQGMYGSHQLLIQYAEELELTDNQKKEIIAIGIEYRQQFRGNTRGVRQGTRRGEFRQNNGPGMNLYSMRSAEIYNRVLEILTDEQESKLNDIQEERAENAREIRTLRHEVMVENAQLDEDKAARVLDILNRQAAIRDEMIQKRIQSGSTLNRGDRFEWMNEVRSLDDELRSLLTVQEYENLRPGFGQRRFDSRSGDRRMRPGRGR